jgi:hypothetical protein
MGKIKQRRLNELVVHPHAPHKVGEYVPFYFCPRSVMLYMMSVRSAELRYQGGQQPIAHLVIDLEKAISWANHSRVKWVASKGNAGARITEFLATQPELSQINWDAVHASDWRKPQIKDAKQAEFLIHQHVPWHLVEEVAFCTQEKLSYTQGILSGIMDLPPFHVRRAWYY